MSKNRILIVEDEAVLRRIVADVMERAGYCVMVAEDGVSGLQLFKEFRPHLVIADVMLPRLDGFEMVKQMRSVDGVAQILFLSARSSADDVVEGFRVGGHDYLRKPFAMNELLARVEALLQRIGDGAITVFKIGRYIFDSVAQTIDIEGCMRHISYREAAILKALAQKEGNIVNSSDLLMDIWGDDSYYNLRSMNVYISKLRAYLAEDKRIEISSIRGVGYRLKIK